jgi:hypothetical protein
MTFRRAVILLWVHVNGLTQIIRFFKPFNRVLRVKAAKNMMIQALMDEG